MYLVLNHSSFPVSHIFYRKPLMFVLSCPSLYLRPLGPFLLYGLLLALALPFIEIATGIPRGQLISVAASKLSG